MTVTDRLPYRIAAVARGFVLVALGGPVLWTRDSAALVALLILGGVWLLATIVSRRNRVPVELVTTCEGLLVGIVCGLSLDGSLAVLGALAVPPFVASLFRGVWGVAVSISAELSMVVVFAYAVGGTLTAEQGFATFSWSITGIGLGLIGTFLHHALRERTDPLAPYHYAQSLLRQLIDISAGLDSGLDPVALGGSILSAVRDELPTSAVAVYVPRGERLTPLVTKSLAASDDLQLCEGLAVQVWGTGGTVLAGRAFAFPLVGDSGPTGVVAGVIPEGAHPREVGMDDRVRRLAPRLRTSAVHLDTALLFGSFRDAASAEERRRLAREMHDGVAQDIASLGYLADAMAAVATTDAQLERIAVLRDRVSAIVAEIRRSLVNLRTSIGTSESLGAAIAAIARNLSEASGVAIHVISDEQTERLRPEVEAELFRIAQEAMNNAVKHARASAIEVQCQVRAPAARITITDNGRGLQPARKGSHGLEIMRERALMVNGSLELFPAPGGGLCVSLSIPGDGVPEEVIVVPPGTTAELSDPDIDSEARVGA